MTDLQEKAMRMALDVLRNTAGHSNQSQTRIDDAKHALVQALAQPEQRPVGTYEGVMETMLSLRKGTLEQQQIYTHMKDKLLYTAPPKREWVGLTDEEMFGEHTKYLTRNEWALMIEAKLKEKNT